VIRPQRDSNPRL